MVGRKLLEHSQRRKIGVRKETAKIEIGVNDQALQIDTTVWVRSEGVGAEMRDRGDGEGFSGQGVGT